MPDSKPNILVIWGDDIGITNLSCYSDGLMGYRTPNIDRIADEGMRFTYSYGEQSCTAVAGRSFITSHSVYLNRYEQGRCAGGRCRLIAFEDANAYAALGRPEPARARPSGKRRPAAGLIR